MSAGAHLGRCIEVHSQGSLIYLHCDLQRIILQPIDQGHIVLSVYAKIMAKKLCHEFMKLIVEASKIGH